MKLQPVLFAFILATSNAQFNFTPIPENTPIIITKLAQAQLSYDTFKLVFISDLSPYYQLQETITGGVETIQNLTSTIYSPTINFTINQLLHQVTLLNNNEETLNSFRSKRFIACEFCGKINHFITGVMDAETARKYDNAFNGLRNQTIEDHKLIRNQSIIFNSSLTFNKQTFQKIEDTLNSMNNNINDHRAVIERQIRVLQAKTDIQNLIQSIQLALSDHHRIFGQIRRALLDARRGKLTELIPKQQLTNELKLISNHLKSNQRLPINPHSEDALHIFKYSSLSSTIYNKKMIIEVTIPIAEREEYNLYKATPIPTKSANGYIIPVPFSTYYLLNPDQTKYIPISAKQLDAGTKLTGNVTLNRPTNTVFLSNNKICEWKIMGDYQTGDLRTACQFIPFLNYNTLISILTNDLYFILAPNSTNLQEKCNNGDYQRRTISGRGIIHIDPDCTIKTTNYIIRNHKTTIANSTKIILPTLPTTFNYSRFSQDFMANLQNATTSNPEPIIIHDATELQNIISSSKKLVEQAKHEIKLKEIHYDSTTNSLFTGIFSGILSSSTLFLITAMAITLILCKCNLFSCFINHLIKKSASMSYDSNGAVIIDMENRASE